MQELIAGSRGKKRGFTLIELLVVIAIIAILAAILFPVFARARENARKSACQSNLKQIGLAAMQYVQDFDEKYPIAAAYSGGRWYEVLQPYARSTQVFACPTSGAVLAANSYGWNMSGTWSAAVTGNTKGGGFGYIPTSLRTPDAAAGVSLSAIEEASTTFLVSDPSSNGYGGNGLYAIGYLTKDYMPVLHGGAPYSTTAVTLTDFSGGGNFLYADGHVKFIQADRSYRSRQWNIEKSVNTNVIQP